MSSSESDLDGSCTSDGSECSVSSFVRVEFEENEMLEGQSSQEVNNVVGAPYSDEPLASDEWIQNYQQEKTHEETIRQDLQNRLDKVIPASDWCTCGNCDIALSQNVYEAQCCKEIEGCVEALQSDIVLQDTITAPSCITLHPGFRPICLEKWSLRMAAVKYRRKDRQKYRQNSVEETFLRSVAYREFCRLIYGCMGKVRIPLPSCAYHAIRKKFHVDEEQMKGFEEDS